MLHLPRSSRSPAGDRGAKGPDLSSLHLLLGLSRRPTSRKRNELRRRVNF